MKAPVKIHKWGLQNINLPFDFKEVVQISPLDKELKTRINLCAVKSCEARENMFKRVFSDLEGGDAQCEKVQFL